MDTNTNDAIERQVRAEKFVANVLRITMKQDVSDETVRAVAEKVSHSIPMGNIWRAGR